MQVPNNLVWVKVVLAVLDFAKSFIPAFLVAYAERLRRQKERLEALIRYDKFKAEKKTALDNERATHEGQDPIDVINDHLQQSADSTEQDSS